jgi:transcriptional regulator with XRE-family HTH domain
MTCRFDFGKSLRLAQVKLGVSSSELASDMGITKQQVSQWRYQGRRKVELGGEGLQASENRCV